MAVGNNNPVLCICGNDGGNYSFAKIIIYFRNDFWIRKGSVYLPKVGIPLTSSPIVIAVGK